MELCYPLLAFRYLVSSLQLKYNESRGQTERIIEATFTIADDGTATGTTLIHNSSMHNRNLKDTSGELKTKTCQN